MRKMPSRRNAYIRLTAITGPASARERECSLSIKCRLYSGVVSFKETMPPTVHACQRMGKGVRLRRAAVTSVARRGRAVTPFDDKLKRRACLAHIKRTVRKWKADSLGVKCFLKPASILSAHSPLL